MLHTSNHTCKKRSPEDLWKEQDPLGRMQAGHIVLLIEDPSNLYSDIQLINSLASEDGLRKIGDPWRVFISQVNGSSGCSYSKKNLEFFLQKKSVTLSHEIKSELKRLLEQPPSSDESIHHYKVFTIYFQGKKINLSHAGGRALPYVKINHQVVHYRISQLRWDHTEGWKHFEKLFPQNHSPFRFYALNNEGGQRYWQVTGYGFKNIQVQNHQMEMEMEMEIQSQNEMEIQSQNGMEIQSQNESESESEEPFEYLQTKRKVQIHTRFIRETLTKEELYSEDLQVQNNKVKIQMKMESESESESEESFEYLETKRKVQIHTPFKRETLTKEELYSESNLYT